MSGILEELGLQIPRKYYLQISGGQRESRYILAVHINWIRQVILEKRLPSEFPIHDTLTDDQILAFISQGKSHLLGSFWIFLHVTVHSPDTTMKSFRSLEHLNKPSHSTTSIPAPFVGIPGTKCKTWSQMVDFIGESNFNYVWEQPEISLLDLPTSDDSLSASSDLVELPEENYFKQLLEILYVNHKSSISAPSGESATTSSEEPLRFSIANLAQPLSILLHKNVVLIFNLYTEHTLQDCVNFSPHKLSTSNVKQLFVLYQLLQLIHDMETLNIPTGNITLSDIWTDESLYITVMPNLSEILQKLQIQKQESIARSTKLDKFLEHCVKKVKSSSADCNDQDVNPELIESVIRHWCEGLVTNYEYLMFLNYLAGRYCNVNPNYHPVFPWVCDFTVQGGGWRDLTKSKFRLNKGERQLDLMYEEKGAAGVATSVPHHVTDILSEITYYVYKARQTPKEVLCKFVRPKWVPAEYPVSVQRIFEWTPDECIPEFFDDPSIFSSIHEDLPDLQPPAWASSPTEFIKLHRDLLDSDNVSAKLHHWIDHTFGYKLSGNPAVKSKNIYLSLVDHHQNLSKSGIVQLFQVPHPPRKSMRRNMKNTVKYADLKKMRDADPAQEKEYITLPRHYDPSGFLNDFEVCLKFFTTHFNNISGITLRKLKSNYCQSGDDSRLRPEKHSEYMKLFGCLLVELVLANKVHFVSSKLRDINERFSFYRKIVRTLEPIPIFIKRTLQVIFTPKESFDFSIPLRISIELLLSSSGLSPTPFPKYFDSVYKLVRSLRNYDSSLKTSDPADTSFRFKVEELKVKSFSRDLIQILNDLDKEGLDLVLPFVLELFRDHNTRVLAVWNIFCPFSRAIGREKSVKNLLQPIIQIYETDYNSDKHLKLFHRSFLLQLKSCFGLELFLENFVTLLIEAIGGWKHLETSSTNPTPTHLKSFHDIEETKSKPLEQRAVSVTESLSGDHPEPQMFLMDQDSSDAEDSPPVTKQLSGLTLSSYNSSVGNRLSSSESDNIGCGSTQAEGLSTSNFDAKSLASTTESDITEMCCESVIWLVHRIGPVLSAKYVSKNLLRMLTLCYLGHLDKVEGSNKYISNSSPCQGDSHAEKVLECLMSVSDLYGDSYIERQYIPYAIDVVNSAKKKLSLTLEAALIGISSLLQRVFAYIDDSLLLTLLNGPVIDSLLKPILDLVTSIDVQFPSGFGPRCLLVNKVVIMLNAIRCKIGPDISHQTLKPLILQLCFRIQNNNPTEIADDGKVSQNFPAVFGPSLAHLIYTHFYAMIVGTDYEIMMHDMVLIFGQVPIVHKDSCTTGEKSNLLRKVEVQSTSSFGSRSFGNRISIQENDLSSTLNEMTSSFSSSNPPKDTTRHLKGNWSIYWDHEFGRSDAKFNFKQIKLQSFSGHTAPVRSIWSLNNENSFLTGSKDKTCRVYSLRNQGDETTVSSSKWTYTHHKKAVLSVLFSEPLHLAASTDGNIHIWDPFVGKLVRILETSLGKSIRCLKPLSNCTSFVGAGIENFVTVVDPRSCQAYELKIGIGQNTGLVRCMSVSPSGDVVSVGHSSGMISSLDLRFGSLLGSWKAHEGEILQLITLKDRKLISSSLDQAICVWNLDDNKLAFNMRGSTEPVHSMTIYESELITCTTSNRIGVHTRIDTNSDFSSTRLRSDTFKGIVTAFNLLPLNQVLLVGADSGLVYLLC